MRSSLATIAFIATFLRHAAAATIPDKIYGVNLGSWLVLEPWMLPQEWQDMGGDVNCQSCSTCIGSEFAFVQAYPETANEKFESHWSTWFTEIDVASLKAVGINTVRIPLGYWIVERLVDTKTEFYPRGGIKHLQRGLKMLRGAGIRAILDHHALPGVQTAEQSFTGHCTTDVEFYTDRNYERALTWTAVMTAISHLDPSFDSVFAIEAVNEPIMDASQTPGYGDFQKNFVQTIRAVEVSFGISEPAPELKLKTPSPSTSNATAAIFSMAIDSNLLDPQVKAALLAAVPIIIDLAFELRYDLILSRSRREPLVANFMDVNWQHNNPPNPADAAIGPMGYDNHLYYSFGGVADANEEAYMISICNLERVENDATLDNTPLWFGEWGLPTEFSASDDFLHKWADAQKLAYSKDRGWIFWNFKTENSALSGDLSRQWSYLDGVKRGYLTRDPSKLHDPNVCKPYVGCTSATAPSATSAAPSAIANASTGTTGTSTRL